MYTKEQLKEDLKKMGLQGTDKIMIHSSYKSIGGVEGGPDAVLDALMEYFAEGLLMLPTHTWAKMSASYNIFDPKTEPACVGLLPNLFRQRPGVLRSLHPTHSIAVYGPEAAAYIEGEEDRCGSPCPPDGCWGRLAESGAYILLLGVVHNRNTFIHSVEEMMDVPDRLSPELVTYKLCMPDGSYKEIQAHSHCCSRSRDVSANYNKLLQAFYDNGAARKVKFGAADCILCEAAKIKDVVMKVWSHNPQCVLDYEEIPAQWWQ